MATNKKSFASQALLEMDDITSAIKEESKKSLSSFLNEAVKNALRESCDEDDDEEYEVVGGDDDKKEEKKDSTKSKKRNSKKSTNEEGEDEVDDEYGAGAAGNNAPQQNQNPQMGAYQNGGQMAQAGNGQMQEPEMGNEEMQEPEMGNEEMQGEMPDDSEGEEGWDDFEKYKVGENTYDLTGENDYDSVVKVYKLLNDEDQVVVKKEGNTIQLQDNEAGTEYVIDLGSEDEEPSAESMGGEEEMPDELNENYFGEWDEDESEDGMAGVPPEFVWDDSNEDGDFNDFGDNTDEFDDNSDEFDDNSDEFDENPDEFGDEFGDEFDEENEGIYENKRNKKNRKPMRESKEVLFEVDLGYTDNYQDKDPIAGLSNDEPSKSGKSWHKGVPTGTQKPWAGDSKSKGDPFKKTQKVKDSVNEEDWANNPSGAAKATMEDGELEEATNVGGKVQERSKGAKSKKPNNRVPEHGPYGQNNVSTAEKGYIGKVEESKQLKAIKNENKELKKAIVELRKNLNEAYITNVNLGKIAKLFLENTTSQKEKIEIVNRFSNEAKTVEQSKALYESISRQLKKTNKSLNINESSRTANGTQVLNEEKVYKSPDLLKTIEFMNRVLDC